MISTVILAKNEEENIQSCLESVSWCDERLVIDDESTDDTVQIAKNLKATVITHPLSDFAAQRNFALQQVRGDWVLFLDADERVTPELREEILTLLQNSPTAEGYFLKRDDFLFGRMLRFGETAHVRLLRLGKKHAGKWRGGVHETWEVSGKTSELQNSLLHLPHQSIAEFLRDINYYSDIRAKDLFRNKVTVNFFSIIAYPKAKFAQNYLQRLGFLDGIAGLVVAVMMSFHSFLVRGKLWLLWQKKSTT